MTSRILLSGHGVGVHRKGRWLIYDIDIEIAAGEVVTLVGPNGGGKSTLVKTLLGLMKPDAGQVMRDPKVRIGYVPPADPLQFELPMSVRRLMSLTAYHSAVEIDKALEETGAQHLLDAQVNHLSHGELQRAMLARALLPEPELLVMDEPLRGVDFSSEATLYQLISDVVARRHCAVLMTSHDLHYVMSCTDRVVCLNGTVRCAGVPGDAVLNPEFRELFGARADVYQHVRHQCTAEQSAS